MTCIIIYLLGVIPLGGDREETARTVVDFFERLFRENRELKLLLCRLNMVDISKQDHRQFRNEHLCMFRL